MKIKGISIWERYIEHIVLGVAVVVCIAFTALQVIRQPNTVTVRNESFTPQNVNEKIRAEAEQLRGRLTPDAEPPVELKSPDLRADQFASNLTSPLSPQATLDPVQMRLAIGGTTFGRIANEPFVVPEVPAPTNVLVSQYYDALTSETLSQHEQLKEVVIDGTPSDVTWNTAGATFALKAFLDQYKVAKSEQEGGAVSVPSPWYTDNGPILDVVCERQEYVDGQWGNTEVVEPLADQLSVRETIQKSADEIARDELLEKVKSDAAQDQILRPTFFATRGDAWLPPQLKEAASEQLGEKAEKTRSLTTQLYQLRNRKEQIERRLEELGGGGNAPGGGGGLGGGGGGLGGGGGGLGGGGGAGSGGSGGSGGNDPSTKQRLEEQLKEVTARIEDLEKQLEQLTGKKPGEELFEGMSTGDEVAIWAHDINIEPGKTYRYRFTIKAYNPLFQRSANLVEQQKPLADQVALVSQASDWSNAMTVEPPVRLFIVDAKAGQQGQRAIGGVDFGRATAEVFRFYDGRWWSREFNAAPGDRIGAVKLVPPYARANPDMRKEIDFSTEWYVLDVFYDYERGDSQSRDAATVLLQDINEPEYSQTRSPMHEPNAAARTWLRNQVELAEQQARQDAPPADDGPSPPQG